MAKFRIAVDGDVSEAIDEDLIASNDDEGVRWFARNAGIGDEYRIGGGAAPVFELRRIE